MPPWWIRVVRQRVPPRSPLARLLAALALVIAAAQITSVWFVPQVNVVIGIAITVAALALYGVIFVTFFVGRGPLAVQIMAGGRAE